MRMVRLVLTERRRVFPIRAFWKRVEPVEISLDMGSIGLVFRVTSFVFKDVVDPRGLDDFFGFGVEFDVVEFKFCGDSENDLALVAPYGIWNHLLTVGN